MGIKKLLGFRSDRYYFWDQGTEQKSKMAAAKLSSVLTIIAEVALWLLISVLTFLLAYNMAGIEPTKRGFFCDDETIQYPYMDDTVSDTLLAVTFVVAPILIMICIETFHLCASKGRKAIGSTFVFQKLFVRIYRTVGAFLFAAVCTMLLTETTKLFGGRLRPHFMSLCKPEFSKLNCSDGYIMIYPSMCTSDITEKKLLDARKSFPSGHASLAAFSAIYLLIYLHLRMICLRMVRIVVPLIQVGIVCAAVFVCISRVNDNKHHSGDVIAGAILGTVVALLTIKYVSCWRVTKTHVQCYASDGSTNSSKTVRQDLNTSTVVEMRNI